MSVYAEIDEAILVVIRGGCEDFNEIHMSKRVHPLAQALAKPSRYGRTEPFRVTDRRLQALRKAGRIVYSDRKWRTAIS
jgi:hypothetical protein